MFRTKHILVVLALVIAAPGFGQGVPSPKSGPNASLESQPSGSVAAPVAQGKTILFAASWCRYCKQARAYLARSKVQYEEVDVDTPAGQAAFARYGKGAVPLLVSKGESLRGYSELAYDYFFANQR